MDRRESIKSLLVGSIASGAVVTGCAPETGEAETSELKSTPGKYGRNKKELARDQKLQGEQFFSESELDTIATLCDLILPAENGYKSANEADVPDFINFIVKDLSHYQLPVRGGLMWLDNYSNELFKLKFTSLSAGQKTSILDQIAYPEDADPDVSQGVKFFQTMRNLVLTGFYTSKAGVDEIGYKGNTPNVWDGVPQEVLEKHGLAYEEDMLSKYVDQSERMDLASWDDEGNLLT